jgi:hypothetical protein
MIIFSAHFQCEDHIYIEIGKLICKFYKILLVYNTSKAQQSGNISN